MAGLTQRRRNQNETTGTTTTFGTSSTAADDPLAIRDEFAAAYDASAASVASLGGVVVDNNREASMSPRSAGSAGRGEEFLARVDDEGFTAEDMHGRKLKLTLLEEVLLLGLKDQQGYLSFWNENISYVLRGCILMELSMRRRIDTFKEFAGRHHRRPFSDRLVEVVDERATGEVLLDEALKLMRAEQQARPVGVSGAGLLASGGKVLGTGRIGKAFSAAFGGSRAGASGSEASASTTTVPSETQTSRQSVSTWIDLMSGETWNLNKISYQLKQVRERLAKGLVDKGVLRTDKTNFLMFEMATHPIADPTVKMEVVMRVVNALLGRGPPPTRRTIALLAAAYAANVIENALSAAVASGAVDLTYSQKDACFARCEELLVEWSGVNAFELMLDGSVQPVGSGAAAVAANRWQGERERMGWTDVMAGVVGVYLKMDSML